MIFVEMVLKSTQWEFNCTVAACFSQQPRIENLVGASLQDMCEKMATDSLNKVTDQHAAITDIFAMTLSNPETGVDFILKKVQTFIKATLSNVPNASTQNRRASP